MTAASVLAMQRSQCIVTVAVQVLANRVRPAAVPSYEILYGSASTTAAKLLQMRTAKADALLQVQISLLRILA